MWKLSSIVSFQGLAVSLRAILHHQIKHLKAYTSNVFHVGPISLSLYRGDRSLIMSRAIYTLTPCLRSSPNTSPTEPTESRRGPPRSAGKQGWSVWMPTGSGLSHKQRHTRSEQSHSWTEPRLACRRERRLARPLTHTHYSRLTNQRNKMKATYKYVIKATDLTKSFPLTSSRWQHFAFNCNVNPIFPNK